MILAQAKKMIYCLKIGKDSFCFARIFQKWRAMTLLISLRLQEKMRLEVPYLQLKNAKILLLLRNAQVKNKLKNLLKICLLTIGL